MLMRRLLDSVHAQRARTLIVDIAGVAMVDTAVATALVRTVQGLRMLGCEVVISGISAPVASSLVQLGASLGDVRTVRSPEEALATFTALN
jgi:anti-anti-sigma regulatory factor